MSIRFLNYSAYDSQYVVDNKHERYRQYLIDNESAFPREAFTFAIADWHYNPTDHKCPHDSWVESLEIKEIDLPVGDQQRGVDIQLRLKGAYHDGKIEIQYENVRGYGLAFRPDSSYLRSKWHGDWIIDEITLSDEGLVIHEINFWLNGNWQIECENIIYNWLPDSVRS